MFVADPLLRKYHVCIVFKTKNKYTFLIPLSVGCRAGNQAKTNNKYIKIFFETYDGWNKGKIELLKC